MTAFTADAIAFQNVPELNLVAVIIAERGSGARLEIQRNLAPDETDKMLGLATYSVNLGAASHYGGITAWQVTEDTVTLTLDEAASQALGTGSEYSVTVGAEYQGMLQRGLTKVIDEA